MSGPDLLIAAVIALSCIGLFTIGGWLINGIEAALDFLREPKQ